MLQVAGLVDDAAAGARHHRADLGDALALALHCDGLLGHRVAEHAGGVAQRRRISAVERSSAATMASFTLWWIGASLVAMKRVPMFMPSQPSASAATSPRASAKPPEAMHGDLDDIGGGRQQHQVRHVVLAGMAGALEAVHGDAVDAEALGREAVAHATCTCGSP